jgi:hypothetical protein
MIKLQYMAPSFAFSKAKIIISLVGNDIRHSVCQPALSGRSDGDGLLTGDGLSSLTHLELEAVSGLMQPCIGNDRRNQMHRSMTSPAGSHFFLRALLHHVSRFRQILRSVCVVCVNARFPQNVIYINF